MLESVRLKRLSGTMLLLLPLSVAVSISMSIAAGADADVFERDQVDDLLEGIDDESVLTRAGCSETRDRGA